MAKGNQIKKLVNGEIADADDVNQIVEDAGSEGGSIPYDPTSHERSTDGSQSLGSVAYPWGSLKINQLAELVEVDAVGHTVAGSVAIKDLRKFINQKDTPSTYVGSSEKFIRVNTAADALEFISVPVGFFLVQNGDFTSTLADIDITQAMAEGERYKLVFIANVNGGTNISYGLRINDDSSDYGFRLIGITLDNDTATDRVLSSSSPSEVPLYIINGSIATLANAGQGFVTELDLYITPYATVLEYKYKCWTGSATAVFDIGTVYGYYNAKAATSINVVQLGAGTATITGTWKLYKWVDAL